VVFLHIAKKSIWDIKAWFNEFNSSIYKIKYKYVAVKMGFNQSKQSHETESAKNETASLINRNAVLYYFTDFF
jgi:hypothetical protein